MQKTRSAATSESLLDRSFAILELVASANRPLSVAEIAEQLQLPKPTAHRICARLEAMNILARGIEKRGLHVGPRMSKLALNATINPPSHGPRRAILRSVVEETGETCSLSMLDGDEIVLLDRIESESPLRLQLFSGSRVPLHCTSAGKLFLAMMPEAKRSKLIRSAPLKRMTENTITDHESLERELAGIREERLSRDNEEFVTGLVAIAVPVVDKNGRICAALSINAPRARMNLNKIGLHVAALRRAAKSVLGALVSDSYENAL